MIKRFLVFFFLTYISLGYTQNYSVSSFQKINELNGNFSGNLDVNDNFGISIDNIGDLDGNGVNDLAVGAYTDDDGASDQGAVWILFMDANNQVISHTKISGTSGNFTGDLDPSDRFGGAVAYLGDLNNDGRIELAVGADYDGDGGFWHGAVWILSLNNDGTVFSHAKISDTQGGFTGFINGDAIFGTDIENIGDLNGDGIQDLAVGSRRDADGGSRRGAVWILFMNADFTVNSYQKISDTQGNFAATLQFEDYFGGSVLNIGDLDQDGVTDIVVGAYRDDDQIANSGSFYVLFLNTNGTVKYYQKVSNLVGGFTGIITVDALFGESIDGVTDIDNDGKIEIVVGALRQQNPAQLTQTGAFYLIELNTDGTVSEERMYTFGENCFGGTLNAGDFFGGSVTVLNDAGTYRFAVGAYRDSENGNDKGAVWIIELGELPFSILTTQDPSGCNTSDGEIIVGNLSPNSAYSISYEFEATNMVQTVTSNNNGELSIAGLAGGNYTNIIVSDIGTGCSDDIGSALLNAVSFNVNHVLQSPTICGATDGSILLSGVSPNAAYQIQYDLNAVQETLNITSDANGEILISNLSGGLYTSFEVLDVNLNCTDILGDIFIDQPTFTLTFTESDVSSCGSSDGAILISGLVPNNSYVVDYFYQSNLVQNTYNADANGEILLANLSEGLYEFIMVVDQFFPCTDGIGALEIEATSLMLTSSVTNPSGCGVNDGAIELEGATANAAYTVSYTLNGVVETVSVTADASGVIVLDNLGSGNYTSIVVEEVATNCTTTIGDLLLDSANFTLTTSILDPSGCGINDGAIFFQSGTANEAFTVSYVLNGAAQTVSVTADASGVISLNNLVAGNYTSIVVEEVATSCTTTIGDLLLDGPNLNLTASVTDPSGCGITDGIITFQTGNANEIYIVSYTLNGATQGVSITADASGVILLDNLAAGNYTSITVEDVVTTCIATIDDLLLDSGNFTLIASVTDPSGCGITDGTISFQSGTANETYAVSYVLNGAVQTVSVTADASGSITIYNLGSGLYESIVVEETATNCIATIGNLLLESSDLSLTFLTVDPSVCNISDGQIIFQDANPNTAYTISYELNSTAFTVSITANTQGQLILENLSAGTYVNIFIEESGSSCTDQFTFVELSCEDETEQCFRVRKFFTPNNDGYNDIWYLEEFGGCNYIVNIFDRYGKLLKTLTPNFPAWDGTYGGRALPSSDYWISIDYTSNDQQYRYTTNISLRR